MSENVEYESAEYGELGFDHDYDFDSYTQTQRAMEGSVARHSYRTVV